LDYHNRALASKHLAWVSRVECLSSEKIFDIFAENAEVAD